MENERRVQQKAPAGRYALLDELRGLDLVSMMLYHACWDMMFLFGIWMDWYAGMPGRLWQQSICWVFILLSGFCVPLGHRTLKRGAQVFAAGALVTVWSREAPPCHITMVGSHHPLREPDLHLSMYPALLSFGQQLLTGCGLQHGIFCTQPAFYAVLQSLQPPMPACP